MPKAPTKSSTEKPPSLVVEPMTLRGDIKPRVGRPPKPKLPALPDFKMTNDEQAWFDYHTQAFMSEYDMTATDHIHLMLAGVEFIKWLRMSGTELSTKELISQARQHPGPTYMRLMDSLSFNRKSRKAEQKAQPREDASDAWIDALSN